MNDVFHHLIHEGVEIENDAFKKIHSKKWVRFFDKYIYAFAFAGLVLTLPQIYQIWILRQASGVSLVSWSAYLAISFVWLLYGIGHREKAIIFTNFWWIVLDILIVAGVLVIR